MQHSLNLTQLSEGFIELNPTPIIEVSKKNGLVYLNLAAKLKFPSISIEGMEHPLLSGLIKTLDEVEETLNKLVLYVRDIEFNNATYEQQVFTSHGSDSIYISISQNNKSNELVYKKVQSQHLAYVNKIRKLTNELKNYHHAFSKARNHHNLALKSANAGTWHWNLINDVVIWDGPMNELFGIDDKYYISNIKKTAQYIYKEDVFYVSKKILAILKSTDSFSFDCRILRKDGAIRLINLRGKAYFNESNEPISMSGISIDKTI